jgi:phosphoribosylformimino-5-aminoimidazole carboxamide ribotide isomerase
MDPAPFTVIPAIDVKGGRCVRLWQGDMDKETVYAQHPEEVARRWRDLGATLIHVVDLDGAVGGSTVNREAIRRILAAVDVPIEVGGGIRDRATMEMYHALGVSRVILGTAACRQPERLPELLRGFPGQVWVGIDARDGLVAVDGWTSTLPLTAARMASHAEDAGAAGVIYTDISRDGTLVGPNLEALSRLLEETRLPVIASGGVSVPEDVARVAALAPRGVVGVIVGRALYTGAVDLAQALRHQSPPVEPPRAG